MLLRASSSLFLELNNTLLTEKCGCITPTTLCEFLCYSVSSFTNHFKVKVKVTQWCPTLCNPMDYRVHGILPAGILEWVAIPIFRGSSQPRDGTQVSHIAGGFFTS